MDTRNSTAITIIVAVTFTCCIAGKTVAQDRNRQERKEDEKQQVDPNRQRSTDRSPQRSRQQSTRTQQRDQSERNRQQRTQTDRERQERMQSSNRQRERQQTERRRTERDRQDRNARDRDSRDRVSQERNANDRTTQERLRRQREEMARRQQERLRQERERLQRGSDDRDSASRERDPRTQNPAGRDRNSRRRDRREYPSDSRQSSGSQQVQMQQAEIAPGQGTQITVELPGDMQLDEVRALRGNSTTNDMRAYLGNRAGNRQALIIRVEPDAPAARNYQVQGISGGAVVARLALIEVTGNPSNTDTGEDDSEQAPGLPSGGPDSNPDPSPTPSLAMLELEPGGTFRQRLPRGYDRIDGVRVMLGRREVADVKAALGGTPSRRFIEIRAASDVRPGVQYQVQGLVDGQPVTRLAMVSIKGDADTTAPSDDANDATEESNQGDDGPGYGSGPGHNDRPIDDPGPGQSQDAEDLYETGAIQLSMQADSIQVAAGINDVTIDIQRNGYEGSMYLMSVHNDPSLLPPSQANQVKALMHPFVTADGAPFADNQATVRITVQSNTPIGTKRYFKISGHTVDGQREDIAPLEFEIEVVAAEVNDNVGQPDEPSPQPDTGDSNGGDDTEAPVDAVATDTGTVYVDNWATSPLSPGQSALSGASVGAFYDVNGDGLMERVNGNNDAVYPRIAVPTSNGINFMLREGRAFHPGSDIMIEGHLNWASVNRPQYVVLYLKRTGNSLSAVQMWAGDIFNNAPIPLTDETTQGVVMNSSDNQIELHIEEFVMPSSGDAGGRILGVATANVYFTSPNGGVYGSTVSFSFDCPVVAD